MLNFAFQYCKNGQGVRTFAVGVKHDRPVNKHPRVNRLQHGIFNRHGSDSRMERKLRRFIPLPDKLKLPQSGVCFSLQAPIAVRACQGLRSTHQGCVADRTPFCIAHPHCEQGPVRNRKRDVRLSPDAAGCCAEHCCTDIFSCSQHSAGAPVARGGLGLQERPGRRGYRNRRSIYNRSSEPVAHTHLNSACSMGVGRYD